MAATITVLYTPGCPAVTLLRERLAEALTHSDGSASQVSFEEVSDPDDVERRGFHGSPALLIDDVDALRRPRGFACRTYRTESGDVGAPSVDQIAAALTDRER